MVDGNIANRDRLLGYTTGEFFQEMSLFLTEGEERKERFDKILKK